MIWAAGAGSVVLLILAIIGLVDLIRHRDTMEPWQVIVWGALIVLVPLIGLIAYLFWRIFRSEAMQDAMTFSEEQMPGPGDPPPPSSYS